MGTPIGELINRRKLDLGELKDQKVGFDSFNILYQFLANIRGPDGEPLTDSKGRVTSHLTGLLYRTANLVDKNIKPVFVFDGKHHELKSKTIAARMEVRTNAAQKAKDSLEAGDLESAKKYASMSSHLKHEMVDEAKELAKLMGFPVVQAPSEGEAQLSMMVQKGELFAGVSQDFDSLLFGCPRLVRNLTFSGKRKLPGRNVYIDVEPEIIELNKVLAELQIDRKKLIWLSILVGTDFNEKFPKIGPKTAIKLVKEHDSFEEIIQATNYSPNFNYREIEDLFLKAEYATDFALDFSKPDVDGIVKFLVDEHDFSKERVLSVAKKLEDKFNEKGKQSSLSAWS
ncbi:MAG: flap endonuclease-1 [Candidatus Micrarchaeota archaeon]